MLKRIITAVFALCILVPVLVFSDTVVFPCAVALVTVIALFEAYRCIDKAKKLVLCVPAYLFALVSPFIVRYVENRSVYVGVSFAAGVAFVVYLFFFTVASKGKMKFGEAGEFFSLTLYIIAAMNSIIYIRDFGESGKYLYILIFVGAWVTDTFAYFTGVFFGKHKLIPEVSPKKTVEGSIGGTLFCTAGYVVFGVVGDDTRKSITVISDSVNFTAKIGDINKVFGSLITFSKSTLNDLSSNAKINYRYK